MTGVYRFCAHCGGPLPTDSGRNYVHDECRAPVAEARPEGRP